MKQFTVEMFASMMLKVVRFGWNSSIQQPYLPRKAWFNGKDFAWLRRWGLDIVDLRSNNEYLVMGVNAMEDPHKTVPVGTITLFDHRDDFICWYCINCENPHKGVCELCPVRVVLET